MIFKQRDTFVRVKGKTNKSATGSKVFYQ